MNLQRCSWPSDDPLMIAYHDQEWGVPVHDDLKWFEFIVLDTFQAGLSWKTVLHKRENFRNAFDGFDFNRIVNYNQNKINKLLLDPGIIRNRQKINACINNARAFLRIIEQYGSFDKYIWQFTGGKTIVNHWTEDKQIPAKSPVSDSMSKALKKQGFSFVGSTTCYAFIQAGGIVNDHLTGCFRHSEVQLF